MDLDTAETLSIRTATPAALDAATMYALLRLRTEVFVVEQRCPYQELDGRDLEPDTRHLWLTTDGYTPLSYLRLLGEPGGEIRIGRVCTAAAARGLGYSKRLMARALEHAGKRACVLNAQSHLAAFYAGFGFTATGATFDDDGIPHIPMRRG